MNKIFFLALSVFFISCNKESDNLILAYNDLQTTIEEFDSEKIYNKLDHKSKEYVDFLVDSINVDYSKMKAYGKSVGYPLFSTIYQKTMSDSLKLESGSLEKLLFYLRLSSIPMFNAFQESKLVKDQVKTGKENYVTVALKMSDNTFITSKIIFAKEEEGYQFNLLSMLKTSEKLYNQQFKRYVSNYQKKMRNLPSNKNKGTKEINYPDDMLKLFLEDMYKSENQLNSFSYRK